MKEASYSSTDIHDLDTYYEDCVIGGPGSLVSIKDRDKFKEAIRTKLILEVAGRTPEHQVVSVAGKEPRIPCLIGEKIWQDRWGRSAYGQLNANLMGTTIRPFYVHAAWYLSWARFLS